MRKCKIVLSRAGTVLSVASSKCHMVTEFCFRLTLPHVHFPYLSLSRPEDEQGHPARRSRQCYYLIKGEKDSIARYRNISCTVMRRNPLHRKGTRPRALAVHHWSRRNEVRCWPWRDFIVQQDLNSLNSLNSLNPWPQVRPLY